MAEAAKAQFFKAKHFAVAGASSDPKKYGHRVFKWYLMRDIPVTPINPGSSTVTVDGKEYATVASPSKLSNPESTSLSVITPPPVTARLLKPKNVAFEQFGCSRALTIMRRCSTR